AVILKSEFILTIGCSEGSVEEGLSARLTLKRIVGMTRRRHFMLAATTVSLTIIACLVLAEIVLRFFPVDFGIRPEAVTADRPIFHFTPNLHYVHSRNWNFELVNY